MSADFPAGNPGNNGNNWSYEHLFPASNSSLVANRYELLELIGRGASSRIYRGLDHSLQRIVAVKLLREEYRADKTSLLRFEREARAVASLSNPHIVDVYDYGQYQDTYFIVMQYIEGLNLKDMLRYEGPFPPAQAVNIADQILEALATAHAKGIIHRDVKPQNILIQSSDGQAKLADFGVAHTLDSTTITTVGTPIGTVHYMSPEQTSGGKIGPATDLYAVGVVLYEMLSGRLPFEGTNQMQIALQHLSDPPPSFQSIGVNGVPPALEQVVQKALAKDPSQRYQSAAEMRAALKKALAPADPAPRPVPVAPPQPRPTPPRTSLRMEPAPARSRPARFWLPALLGLMLLVGLGIVIFGLLSSQRPAETVSSRPPVSSLPPATATSVPTTQAATNPPVPAVVPDPPTAVNEPATATQAATTAAQEVTTAPATTLPPLPTNTPQPQPTATQPDTSTAVRSVGPTVAAGISITLSRLNPYDLSGAYKRDDGRLYGRPQIALYGAGSGYERGAITFTLASAPNPNSRVTLVLGGLDDERDEHCNLQIGLNGTVIFDNPDTFPNVPNGDTGEGGNDRYWGQMTISVPAGLLRAGTNTLALRNTTGWLQYIGPPYILVSTIELVALKP